MGDAFHAVRTGFKQMISVAKLSIVEVFEGQSFYFDAALSGKLIDEFSELTGDVSPLHMDPQFARQRGFQHRVVHGAILVGLVSRLVGVHLPGRDCLMHSMAMKFLAPVYANEIVRVSGIVEQISIAAKAMTVQVSIMNINSQSIVVRGKVTVGFTEDKYN